MIQELTSNWRKIKLTEKFLLGEFFVSSFNPKAFDGYIPTSQQVDDLLILCTFGLQHIRDQFGEVQVDSGFRTKELNASIGGVNLSQHTRCKAVDFFCPEANMKEVFTWCRYQLDWPGELIFYRLKGHIHIGLPEFGVFANQYVKED